MSYVTHMSTDYYTIMSVLLHLVAFGVGSLIWVFGQRESDSNYFKVTQVQKVLTDISTSELQRTFTTMSNHMLKNILEVHPDKGTEKAILEVIAKLQYIRRDAVVLPTDTLRAIDAEIERLKDLYLSGAKEIETKKVA